MTQPICAVLLASVLLGFAAHPASAQTPARIRASHAASVLSRPTVEGQVVGTVPSGAILEVLDSDEAWFWVALPPDQAGARRRGWIRARDVETAVEADPRTANRQASGGAIPPTSADLRHLQESRHALEQARREYDAVAQRTTKTDDRNVTEIYRPAAKQNARPRQYEVFAGYSLLRDQSDGVNLPLGWTGSVGGRLNDTVAVVGEVSGSYKTVDALGVTMASARIHMFRGGPRFSADAGGATVFGRVLAGIAISSGSVLGGLVSASSTGFAVTPGAGVDLPIARRLGIRVGGDVDFIRDSGSWFNGFRLTTGLVVSSRQR